MNINIIINVSTECLFLDVVGLKHNQGCADKMNSNENYYMIDYLLFDWLISNNLEKKERYIHLPVT